MKINILSDTLQDFAYLLGCLFIFTKEMMSKI